MKGQRGRTKNIGIAKKLKPTRAELVVLGRTTRRFIFWNT